MYDWKVIERTDSEEGADVDRLQRQLLQRKMDHDLPIGFMAVWKERKEIFTCYSLSSGK